MFAEVSRIAELHPNEIALETGRGCMTNAELVREARRVAAELRARGIASGRRVGLICENRPEWLRCYLAVSAAGAETVGVDHDLDDVSLRELLHGACALVGSADALARLSSELRADLAGTGVALLDLAFEPFDFSAAA